MKHTAEVHPSPNTVRLIVSMRPAAWKKWALGILIGFLMVLPFAVALLTGTDDSGGGAVLPVIGVIVLLSFWPGMPLLWNVKGEEWIEVSRFALRTRQNWGFFQTSGTHQKFHDLRLIPRLVRKIDGVEYLTLEFWSTDENGFDKHLFSNVIPMPETELQTFFAEVGSSSNPWETFRVTCRQFYRIDIRSNERFVTGFPTPYPCRMIRSATSKCVFALFLMLFSANTDWAQSYAKPNGVQVETIIEADAAKVWAILLRFEDYPNWNPYITKIEGKAEKGKRLHIQIDGKEKDYDFKAKVLEMRPDSAFAWGGGALFFFKARHYFKLEYIGEGRIKFTQGESWRGLFGKSYGKKVYQEADENFQRMNLKLKEMAE